LDSLAHKLAAPAACTRPALTPAYGWRLCVQKVAQAPFRHMTFEAAQIGNGTANVITVATGQNGQANTQAHKCMHPCAHMRTYPQSSRNHHANSTARSGVQLQSVANNTDSIQQYPWTTASIACALNLLYQYHAYPGTMTHCTHAAHRTSYPGYTHIARTALRQPSTHAHFNAR
jgi:hypothetical protein